MLSGVTGGAGAQCPLAAFPGWPSNRTGLPSAECRGYRRRRKKEGEKAKEEREEGKEDREVGKEGAVRCAWETPPPW